MILLLVIAAIVFCFGSGIFVGAQWLSSGDSHYHIHSEADHESGYEAGRLAGWTEGYQDCLHGIRWFEGGAEAAGRSPSAPHPSQPPDRDPERRGHVSPRRVPPVPKNQNTPPPVVHR